VVGDLHLALLRAQQRLGHLGHRVPAGELAVQEVARARLLHDIRPGEARHLAEAIVTVDNSTVLHTGIGYDKFLICVGVEERLGERKITKWEWRECHLMHCTDKELGKFITNM